MKTLLRRRKHGSLVEDSDTEISANAKSVATTIFTRPSRPPEVGGKNGHVPIGLLGVGGRLVKKRNDPQGVSSKRPKKISVTKKRGGRRKRGGEFPREFRQAQTKGWTGAG